ncbi:hypothetical protein FG379_000827 [Cryptosporidium bovis]|uniref:uncharacterized protein n=1 Tax=Cryptosporidium bovis TaxID=310047 RepID=UPI003519EB8F|nr:hypothetical protein FG379_000827 [Cryptosporidium bovis]
MEEASENIERGWRLLLERFVWEYNVSRALKRISFTFDEFEQTLHFNCSWIFPQWFLIFLRLSMLIYLLFMLGFDLANYYSQGFLIYWGVYVTNWTYTITIIYYFFATVSTIYSYANNLIGRKNYVKLMKDPNYENAKVIELEDKSESSDINQVINSIKEVEIDDKENNYMITPSQELNVNKKESIKSEISEVQMVNIDLENQNKYKFRHESINSLSTTNESPSVKNILNNNLIVCDGENNSVNNNNIDDNFNEDGIKVINKNKIIKNIDNVSKRYIKHLKDNQFIVKYSDDGIPYFADEISQKMDNTTTNINLPLLIRLMWLFHTISLPSSFIVAIVYWVMNIISPVSVDEFTYLTFNKHGIIAITLSIDTFITSIPFFISHTLYSFFYCLTYLIFTVVYFVLKLPSPQGKDDLGFIYPAINFADPAVAVPCSLGIFIVLFLTSNIIWFFAGYSRNHAIDPLPRENKNRRLSRVNHYV